MKILSLLENTSHREDISAEHGLSLYIEACGKRILFDAGQSDAFLRNARQLGVDLSLVDIAILSHGHYDHGGGLRHFCAVNNSAPVYVRESATLPYYHGQRYIGLDTSGVEIIIFTGKETDLGEGLTLVTLDCEGSDSAGLTVRVGEEYLPDGFDHEQYLLIREGGRRVLISGCSHKGIVAIARHFRPDALVGGFHLMGADEEKIRSVAEQLSKIDCDFYTCHCTGENEYAILSKNMKRIKYLSAGDGIEI